MTQLPRGTAFCSPFRHTQERACSASSYIFMACCVAASSPFPGENDAFENDHGHHRPQKQPGCPNLGSRRSLFSRKSWPGRDSGTLTGLPRWGAGTRSQSARQLSTRREGINSREEPRVQSDPTNTRSAVPARGNQEESVPKENTTFSLLYSPLRI